MWATQGAAKEFAGAAVVSADELAGLAAELVDMPGLTVVTNSIPVADALYHAGRPDQTVVLTGGIRTPSDALAGPVAEAAITSLNVDVLFLGVHGMADGPGFTTPNLTCGQTVSHDFSLSGDVYCDSESAPAVVVGAAGNGSHREVDPDFEIGVELPAAADGVVSVAALAQSPQGLAIAPFSNTFAQISGPGVKIVSAKTGGGLTSKSGTSMACPHVAGVAALWWEEVLASPLPANPSTVTAKLLSSAASNGFAAGVEVADREVGIVRAPQPAP